MMLKAFLNHIDKDLPFLRKSKILIALSGGLDSVALTHLCHQAKLNISLAHCNFNLRDQESDDDENFVIKLAEDLNLEVFTQHFDTISVSENQKVSIQMAARELRYEWFDDLMTQLEFDVVLTAHHADDNLETLLINLSRGTGLEGLVGIPEVNGNIVRPLLKFSRETLETYAKENALEWRDDSSNASTKYLRNKLRHDVIPILKESQPHLLQSVSRTQDHLNGSLQIITDAVNRVQRKVISVENGIIKINIEKLQRLSDTKAYLYELLKDFGFTEWDDVYHLLSAQSGKQVFSETYRLLKDRDTLLLIENSEEINQAVTINEGSDQVETKQGVLFFDEADAIFGKRSNVLFVDKDLLNFPLTVRPWEKGDYFYPLGMQGKKKLSKFFKDEKLSLFDKEQVLLLCSGDDVVWILNKRADQRFSVTNKTKTILKITLE